jgi:phosphopantothenoylcysteine decarboxylase/phosphopantothenate--cysteine ligase
MTARPVRVVLGISGSVAAMHAPAVVTALRVGCGVDVHCVLTAAAETFVAPKALAVASGHGVSGGRRAVADMYGAGVEHMQLVAGADLVLVLPATADLVATIAAGQAPDLLTTAILAATCPVIVAPSMNPSMWAKPAVQRNVATLRGDGIGVIDPAVGIAVSDGVAGIGSLPPLPDVLAWIERWTAERGQRLDLTGRLRRVG